MHLSDEHDILVKMIRWPVVNRTTLTLCSGVTSLGKCIYSSVCRTMCELNSAHLLCAPSNRNAKLICSLLAQIKLDIYLARAFFTWAQCKVLLFIALLPRLASPHPDRRWIEIWDIIINWTIDRCACIPAARKPHKLVLFNFFYMEFM